MSEKWVPEPLRQYREGKSKRWIKDNKNYLIGGAAVLALGGLLVWYVYRTYAQRAASPAVVAGAQASEGETGVVTTVEPAVVEVEQVPVKPAKKPRQKGPAVCADAGLPKPYNVYQDDDLVGVNDMSSGPGVVPASVSGTAGVPIDYAGSCSGVNPAAVWQSSQLLPSSCGQTLEGTSDWNIYAPSNYEVTSFLSAGQNFGQDTVSTTLKNASLDLRPEPVIPQAGCTQVPFGQSSWVDNGINKVDWSHSLVA